MKKAFVERMKRECFVTTKKYRYRGWASPTGEFIIQRVPKEWDDETARIRGWETAYVEHNEE